MSKIIGLDQLNLKLDRLSRIDIERAITRQGQLVLAHAKLNVPVKARGGGGELRDSIRNFTERNGNGIRNTTMTNKSYAAYVEFGTGPKGEQNHDGISPKVNPSYVSHGWGIPSDEIDAADAEMYHFPKRVYNGKEYYMTTGQAAHPFMYPALKNNEQKIVKNLRGDLKTSIKKAVKK